DSYAFLENGNGCFMAVLCDGMGTGKKAREESELAVRMLEHFYKNGFDNEAAVEMINSALVLKTEEDHYSTLDLVSVHLQTGNVELVKYGGMPTVLKYDTTMEPGGTRRYVPTIETIRSDTLPVGILGDVSGRTVRKRVYENDMIIMMTDGVFDGCGDMVRFIEELECTSPKQLAESILAESLQWQKEKRPSDDMTVLVLQVKEAS
ncbi:MAG: SpoIIE family protein phosphatase, partial [Oscillospiraceae bacterium]|nr:SpoIIE family protein phosphatase [Oscillospiraceae bacterium]